MTRLAGRVALVTGSSRGIGAEITRLFASEGAAVAVHGRDAAAIESVRSQIESDGGRAIGVLGDVLDEEVLADRQASGWITGTILDVAGGTTT